MPSAPEKEQNAAAGHVQKTDTNCDNESAAGGLSDEEARTEPLPEKHNPEKQRTQLFLFNPVCAQKPTMMYEMAHSQQVSAPYSGPKEWDPVVSKCGTSEDPSHIRDILLLPNRNWYKELITFNNVRDKKSC